MKRNILYYGDNLEVLRNRDEFPDESVDLVYLDPPFNSDATYNVLFGEQDGTRAAAQMKAFEDTWRWDQAAVRAFQETVEGGGPIADLLTGMRQFLGDSNMLAYISMMAPRLVELRRILRRTGSIYLHCDPTASHYLKLVMDAIFGAKNFANEIIWHYHTGGASKVRFSRKHDVILYYGKNERWRREHFNTQREPYREEHTQHFTEVDSDGRRYRVRTIGGKDYVYYLDEGRVCHDVWDIDTVNANAHERQNYPTQKPEALLERIIQASSNESDVVLDPFCGCGTTVAMAHKLGRRWIGIDVTHLAVGLMKHRLKTTFGDDVEAEYEVRGEPIAVEDAHYLAHQDRYQFEWWALGLVGARRNEKKGPDQGVDGIIWFHDEKGDSQKVVLQVKSGKVGTPALKEFRQTIEAQRAALGVFITLEDPSQPMRAEAADAGRYQSGWGDHPKLQLLTIKELLDGARIDMPPMGTRTTFRSAPRYRPAAAEEPNLFDD